MSTHTKTTTDLKPDTTNTNVNVPVSGGGASKELEPARNDTDEAKLLKEVVERSTEADRVLEREVQENIQEAKLARPEIKVSDDLSEHGVKSSQADASQIIARGSDLELPISESSYRTGEISKVDGDRTRQKTIIGVSSLAALALWVGRVIKVAHKHTKRVIFRKGETNANR